MSDSDGTIMEAARPWTIRAGWIFPVTGPPIRGGIVQVQGSRIVSVGKRSDSPVTHDYPNAVVLPGLVNAHVHLEFSRLQSPLGHPGMTLPDWIGQVVAWRRSAMSQERAGNETDRGFPSRTQPVSADRNAAVEEGLAESTRSGVVTVGEIATGGAAIDAGPLSRMQGVVFHELIGYRASAAHEQQPVAAQYFERGQPPLHSVRRGLSPHAPYSVRWELLEWIVEQTRRIGWPLAMHIAESREELEFLASGAGPFRELLERLDAWDADRNARRTSPYEYLRLLSRAARSLIIHGNYLNEKERQWLAANATRMAVVYCPRTHAFFQHEPYPLGPMLAQGVCVAIGTDSRASNPDLNLLAELRFAASRHPDVAPSKILEAGTLAAADALGLGAVLGSLTVGKQADLVVLPIENANDRDPWTLLFGGRELPLATIREGELIAGQLPAD